MTTFVLKISGYFFARKMRAADSTAVRRHAMMNYRIEPWQITVIDRMPDDEYLVTGKLYYRWAREATKQK